jgi:hypothetical protein
MDCGDWVYINVRIYLVSSDFYKIWISVEEEHSR